MASQRDCRRRVFANARRVVPHIPCLRSSRQEHAGKASERCQAQGVECHGHFISPVAARPPGLHLEHPSGAGSRSARHSSACPRCRPAAIGWERIRLSPRTPECRPRHIVLRSRPLGIDLDQHAGRRWIACVAIIDRVTRVHRRPRTSSQAPQIHPRRSGRSLPGSPRPDAPALTRKRVVFRKNGSRRPGSAICVGGRSNWCSISSRPCSPAVAARAGVTGCSRPRW